MVRARSHEGQPDRDVDTVLQPQPVENQPDGTMRLEDIAAAIKPDDPHFARTRLIGLENTTGGKVLPLAYVREVAVLARSRGLLMHLDGARLFNAAVEIARQGSVESHNHGSGLGVSTDSLSHDEIVAAARAVCSNFDTVSVCLSKGLGAPVGSVLVGSHALVAVARRWRKVTGGGMRQAGILAAAGLHALDHHVPRLGDDHARAARLAAALQGLAGVDAVAQHTNMVYVEIAPGRRARLRELLEARQVRASVGDTGPIRLVMHLDVDDVGVARVADAFAGLQ